MKEPCPKCREEGRDRAGNNLHRYPDGGAHCFHPLCDYKERAGGKKLNKRRSKLSLDDVAMYPVGGDPKRKVSIEIYNGYEVRHSVDAETGQPDTVYYPYFEHGKINCYKVRKLPKDFAPLVGDKPKALFGQNVAAGGGRFLLVTEGEEDTLAAKEMLASALVRVDVVALPNGSSLDDVVKSQLDFFQTYSTVVLCFDGDEAGQKAQADVGDWLAPFLTVKMLELDPTKGKDASDYLVSGHASDFVAAFKRAKVYEPEGVINGIDIDLDSLLETEPEGLLIPFDGLQEKLHGLRKGEIVTVCAGSGIGKTTMVRELTHSLIEQGCSIANIALEDQLEVTAKALVALDMNIPLSTFRFSPPPKSEVQPHYDKMVANGSTYFWKHFGGLNSDTLMNKLNYYARSKAVDFIILDHLSMVISSTQSTNERKDIDTLMTQLAKLVVETGVGLIQIVHLKRNTNGKSYAHGEEVELSDLRGSAALEQLSWSVVGMERDQQGDDRNFSCIRVLKNRTFGFTGMADRVYYDPDTGRMSTVVSPLEEPELDTEEILNEESTVEPDVLSRPNPDA